MFEPGFVKLDSKLLPCLMYSIFFSILFLFKNADSNSLNLFYTVLMDCTLQFGKHWSRQYLDTIF